MGEKARLAAVIKNKVEQQRKIVPANLCNGIFLSTCNLAGQKHKKLVELSQVKLDRELDL